MLKALFPLVVNKLRAGIKVCAEPRALEPWKEGYRLAVLGRYHIRGDRH
jgi:hypothetical protein